MKSNQHDIIIMGGGLAGLTLALHLHQRLPDLDILVIERRPHPVPEAAHKVGESSVEIAAHYFDTILGLKEHLASRQLKKFGFRFFFSEAREDVDQVLELGASRYLETPSYQIDRGIFENYLGELARSRGIRFLDAAVIRSFALADTDAGPHEVNYEHEGHQVRAVSAWLIDATGRASLIKRRLDLAQDNGHEANALWFRIGARIDVNEWSDDKVWLGRCSPPDRWLSTIHLVGAGYWVWLIPLSSGSHSVGIVADSKLHPSRDLDTFDKAMLWLHKHQPRLARDLDGKRNLLQDFSFLRSFSYGCKQVFSGQRWALTGEAGVFLDPFYSPGGDFIAIANTYIVDLVARDRAGESIQTRARIYERFYFSFYEGMLTLYRNQYPMFGNPEVFPVKVIWDYTYYWGILCPLFFQKRLADIAMLGRVRDELTMAMAVNEAMQRFMRVWAQTATGHNGCEMIDQASIGWFAQLNYGLRDELDDAGFLERMRVNAEEFRNLAKEIVEKVTALYPSLRNDPIVSLLGPASLAGTPARYLEGMRREFSTPAPVH